MEKNSPDDLKKTAPHHCGAVFYPTTFFEAGGFFDDNLCTGAGLCEPDQD